jgi:hypothetical protein
MKDLAGAAMQDRQARRQVHYVIGCGIVTREASCNTSGVKHALDTANHEHEHHLTFIITYYTNETLV